MPRCCRDVSAIRPKCDDCHTGAIWWPCSTTSSEEPCARPLPIPRGSTAGSPRARAGVGIRSRSRGAIRSPSRRTVSSRRRDRGRRLRSPPRSRAGQPQPAASTVEAGPAGPRQQNVTGAAGADGSLLGSVVRRHRERRERARRGRGQPRRRQPGHQVARLRDHRLGALPALRGQAAVTLLADLGQRRPRARPQGLHRSRARPTARPGPTSTGSTGIDFADRLATQHLHRRRRRASYAYYRLNVTANHGGDIVQLADWDINDGVDDGPPATPDGHRGRRRPALRLQHQAARRLDRRASALRYAGGHTADGRGYAWNRLFDVDIPVGDRLAAQLQDLPRHGHGRPDLPVHLRRRRPALHRRHLPLRPRRRRTATAARPHPSGQGAGKVLYADQWNSVVVDLGAKVAGARRSTRSCSATTTRTRHDRRRRSAAGSTTSASTPRRPQVDGSSPTNYVDTRRGTNASGSFSRGNNLPISAVPNGFTFFTPVDRRELPVVGVLLPARPTTRRTAPCCRAWHLARAQPVDG